MWIFRHIRYTVSLTRTHTSQSWQACWWQVWREWLYQSRGKADTPNPRWKEWRGQRSYTQSDHLEEGHIQFSPKTKQKSSGEYYNMNKMIVSRLNILLLVSIWGGYQELYTLQGCRLVLWVYTHLSWVLRGLWGTDRVAVVCSGSLGYFLGLPQRNPMWDHNHWEWSNHHTNNLKTVKMTKCRSVRSHLGFSFEWFETVSPHLPLGSVALSSPYSPGQSFWRQLCFLVEWCHHPHPPLLHLRPTKVSLSLSHPLPETISALPLNVTCLFIP